MDNKIVGLALTLVVGIILAGSVLMPVVSDAQHARDTTYLNENPYSHGDIWTEEQFEDETVIISICKTGTHTIKINEDQYTVAAWQAVIMSDVFAIRYYSESLQYNSPSGSFTATEVDITISGGNASIIATKLDGTTTVISESFPISWAYIYNPNGDYTAFTVDPSSTTVFYGNKEVVYSSNWITTTSEFFSIKAGEVTVYNGGEILHPELILNGEYQNNGVYSWVSGSGLIFEVDNSGEPYEVHPFMMCLPREVVGTPDDAQSINGLYAAIPILVIVALLVFAVQAIRMRND